MIMNMNTIMGGRQQAVAERSLHLHLTPAESSAVCNYGQVVYCLCLSSVESYCYLKVLNTEFLLSLGYTIMGGSARLSANRNILEISN
jgi:hypothetical protein